MSVTVPTTVASGAAVCSVTRRSLIKSRNASERLVYPRRAMERSNRLRVGIERNTDSAENAHACSSTNTRLSRGNARIARKQKSCYAGKEHGFAENVKGLASRRFDSAQLTARVETSALTDPHLREDWRANIDRILLDFNPTD